MIILKIGLTTTMKLQRDYMIPHTAWVQASEMTPASAVRKDFI